MEYFKDYPLEHHGFTTGGKTFRFAMVKNAWDLLDRISEEEFRESEKMPYWAEIWPGSLVLSEFLVNHEKDKSRSVLEIGAGVGVISVVLGAFGFTDVTATDYDLDALEFIRLNAEANQSVVKTAFLDWTKPQTGRQYDIITGSDIIYEVRNLLPILDVVRLNMKPDGVFYFSDPGRRPMDHFRILIAEAGYSLEAVWEEKKYFRHASPTVTIYKLTIPSDGSS